MSWCLNTVTALATGYYLDSFLLCLTRATHAAAIVAVLLLLLLLPDVHRLQEILHLLNLEVVPESSDAGRRQRGQLTTRRTW